MSTNPASFKPYFPTWRNTLIPFTEPFSKCHSDCHSCSKEMSPVMRLAERFNAFVSLSSLSSDLKFSLAHQKLIPVTPQYTGFLGPLSKVCSLNTVWGSQQPCVAQKAENEALAGMRSRATESHQHSLSRVICPYRNRSVKHPQSLCYFIFVQGYAIRLQLHALACRDENIDPLGSRFARGWTTGFPQM